jgi:hypothetical protein
MFLTSYLGEKLKKNVSIKDNPKYHYFGRQSRSIQKLPNKLSNVAQLVKNCPIWSPCDIEEK